MYWGRSRGRYVIRKGVKLKLYEHWHCEIDNHAIFWASFDKKEASVNTLNKAVLQELEDIIEHVNNNKNIIAFIIKSSKSGFIVGADIDQFRSLKTSEEANQLIAYGQAVYTKLSKVSIPTLSVIHGFCLGGGLELALSCKYRIAQDSSNTLLGLPEVKLGIQPGWGGTIRLPKCIGIFKAMDLMLSGRLVRAKEAQKMGLVQLCVPERLLEQVAIEVALNPNIIEKSQHSKLKNLKKWLEQFLNYPLNRRALAWFFRFQLSKKIQPEHYPAPFEIVNNWEKWGVTDPRAMQEEARSIGRLVVSSVSKNLVHVFYLQEKLKGLAPKSARQCKVVHVIGAGTMGGDIAGWCAIQGLEVTLQDQAPALLGNAIKRTYSLATKKLKEKHLIQAAMDRLTPDPKGLGIVKADIIIEAITENLEAKQKLFKHLEAFAKSDAIFASNTSTIPIEDIASVLEFENRKRVVGVHFFNPVPKMGLVEVVKAQQTDQKVLDSAMAFVRAIDKLPLPVKSAPGFLVNRILLPYMLEAMLLLEEGVACEVIDQAAVNFGMPVGPLELADIVGLDICLAAGEKMAQYGDQKAPQVLKTLVIKGHLGCKTNQGFYHYKRGKLQKKYTKNLNQAMVLEVTNRLVLKMQNEALICLKENIVTDPDFIDAGSIFGFGFAPFRGGLMSYINSQEPT